MKNVIVMPLASKTITQAKSINDRKKLNVKISLLAHFKDVR